MPYFPYPHRSPAANFSHPHRSPVAPYSTARVADAAEEPDTADAATEGEWRYISQPDGSWWVLGPAEDSPREVLVASVEDEDDAAHICDLHNAQARGDTDG